jgi:hypothetical protein
MTKVLDIWGYNLSVDNEVSYCDMNTDCFTEIIRSWEEKYLV